MQLRVHPLRVFRQCPRRQQIMSLHSDPPPLVLGAAGLDSSRKCHCLNRRNQRGLPMSHPLSLTGCGDTMTSAPLSGGPSAVSSAVAVGAGFIFMLPLAPMFLLLLPRNCFAISSIIYVIPILSLQYPRRCTSPHPEARSYLLTRIASPAVIIKCRTSLVVIAVLPLGERKSVHATYIIPRPPATTVASSTSSVTTIPAFDRHHEAIITAVPPPLHPPSIRCANTHPVVRVPSS